MRIVDVSVRQPVTIAVGSHTRVPRTYRGMDTMWWLDQLGVFDRTIDVLILRLRRKIEPNPKHPQYICTERGIGYVFAAQVTRG